MKKALLLLGIGLVNSLLLFSQMYPVPGANFYFTQTSFGNIDSHIKWEYLGDSTVANNRYLKFDRTTLSSSQVAGNGIVIYNKVFDAFNLIERNDSIFYETPIQGRSFICDFNLQTGVSTLSPLYHDWAIAGYTAANCYSSIPNSTLHKTIDSLNLHQKAWVINHGTDNIAGNSFLYYTIEYKYYNPLDPNSITNPIIKQMTFNQRSIFETGATNVPWESFHVCDYGLDDSYITNTLNCYKDAYSFGANCISNEDYFISFSIDEVNVSNSIKVHPIPASTEFTIYNNSASTAYNLQLLSLNGQIMYSYNSIAPNTSVAIPISHISPGMYILKCADKNGNVQTHKIIKN